MEEFLDYNINFRKGLNDSRYCEDVKDVPNVEPGDTISSRGYYDGVQYGIYLIETYQKMAINEENLIAVIHKSYTRTANNLANEKEKNSVR